MRGNYTRKGKIQGNKTNKTRRRKMQVNNSISRNIIKKDIILKKQYNNQVGGGPWEWLTPLETIIHGFDTILLSLATLFNVDIYNKLSKDTSKNIRISSNILLLKIVCIRAFPASTQLTISLIMPII